MDIAKDVLTVLRSIANDMSTIVNSINRFQAITNTDCSQYDPALNVRLRSKGTYVTVCTQCKTPHENQNVCICQGCGADGQFTTKMIH